MNEGLFDNKEMKYIFNYHLVLEMKTFYLSNVTVIKDQRHS
jgi:hypothetical protein